MDFSSLSASASKLLSGIGGTAATVAGAGVSAASVLGGSGIVPLSFGNNKDLANFSGGPCVEAIFDRQQQEFLKQENISETAWDSWTNKFKNNNGGKSRGCVALAWSKQTWKDDHWKGSIKYEWAFTKGDEAILVNGFYDSSDATKDPSQQQQNNDKNNWKAVYINKKTKEVSHGTVKLNINKAWLMWQKREGVEQLLVTKPKLIDDNGYQWSFDRNKKCSAGKCDGPVLKNEHQEATWKWEQGDKSGAETFGSWHSYFDTIFDFIYQGGTKSVESLKALAKEKGSWEGF